MSTFKAGDRVRFTQDCCEYRKGDEVVIDTVTTGGKYLLVNDKMGPWSTWAGTSWELAYLPPYVKQVIECRCAILLVGHKQGCSYYNPRPGEMNWAIRQPVVRDYRTISDEMGGK